MNVPLFLPIAPRPLEDELLSSWQERVACRYGRAVLELERWLEPRTTCAPAIGFEQRDFRPPTAVVELWAQACRLPASSLAGMALSRRARPLAWDVADRSHAGVCPACLDQDTADDGDHYVRRAWSHVEAMVCSRHRQRLRDFCGRCFGSAGFRFHELAGKARLVCMTCLTVVSSCREADRAEPQKTGFLTTLADIVTAVVAGDAGRGPSPEEIMRAAKLLWTPSQADDKPFIAWSGLGLPKGGHGMPAQRTAPLATAALTWRITTLIAIAQLLDLAGARRRFGPPPPFVFQAFAAEPENASQPTLGSAVRQSKETGKPATRLELRSNAEYRSLAEAILASPDWNCP
ncbi:hypothetical protein EOA23_33395, partial [Mesorhizobium sp. M2A.F.Ca.ET.042.01.1.1]